jgi:SAM-dependent methyltransferase
VEPREYERTARVEDRHWWFCELREIWAALLHRAACEPSQAFGILDAGCGTGGNLRAFGGTRHAIGLDISPLALRLARDRVDCPLLQATIDQTPLRDGIFDLVLCADVLYHSRVTDDLAALEEIRRILRPGGHLLVNVPAFDRLRSAHDRAMHTARRYTREQLVKLLVSADLVPVRVVYWNGILLGPAVLLRLLRRGKGDRSELVSLPGPINAILRRLARLDAGLATRGLLPAGLSIAALARRRG